MSLRKLHGEIQGASSQVMFTLVHRYDAFDASGSVVWRIPLCQVFQISTVIIRKYYTAINNNRVPTTHLESTSV